MAAVLFRLAVLAGALGLGEIGLDSFARSSPAWLVQIGIAVVLLVTGSAGFIVPLLEGGRRKEVRHG